MISSRIFVRNLPPQFSEEDFKKHFAKLSTPTDTRLFAARRIGYVGYKTSEDAVKAVKYFNKSFIRMSKIAVEIARPATDDSLTSRRKPNIQGSAKNLTDPSDERIPVATADNLKKRKRSSLTEQDGDPKLQEFLKAMQPPKKSKTWKDEIFDETSAADSKLHKAVVDSDTNSEDEYQSLRKSKRRTNQDQQAVKEADPSNVATVEEEPMSKDEDPRKVPRADDGSGNQDQDQDQAPQSDAEWLRNRTSRLLGLLEEDEEEHHLPKHDDTGSESSEVDSVDKNETRAEERAKETISQHDEPVDTEPTVDADEEAVRKSKRLFLRNLPYDVNEDDIRESFMTFGHLEEVHLPMDNKTGQAKGFGFAQFNNEEAAVEAWRKMDGCIFQGRLLHVLPAMGKRDNSIDEFELSKLPLKQQRLVQKKAEAASSTFNWNSLYMNQDAVVSSIAQRLGISKSDILDPTSSDAAVKQAFAETHIIQETKRYFAEHGVDLEAFKSKRRGDTGILIKNFPYGTSAEELRHMFQEYGKITRLLMPPSGTMAIIEFAVAPEARAAFKSLAYRRIKDSILFLEFAPKDLFRADGTRGDYTENSGAVAPKPSATDLLQNETALEAVDTTTLFVKNLNFATTNEQLRGLFAPLQGFTSARVKTKPDPKKPGQILSMGFGFIAFRTKENAQTALAAMNGYVLDGYKLEIRPSQKAMDAAEERRKEDKAKALVAQNTKIIIKNLPFESSKKEVRTLLGAYGQLRTVRVPKKLDHSARGFAFAEFTSAREAANAMDALHNTHLLGRRLVLEYAAAEPEDAEAEIEKMQKKASSQADKMAVQKLLGTGRRKFNPSGEQQEE